MATKTLEQARICMIVCTHTHFLVDSIPLSLPLCACTCACVILCVCVCACVCVGASLCNVYKPIWLWVSCWNLLRKKWVLLYICKFLHFVLAKSKIVSSWLREKACTSLSLLSLSFFSHLNSRNTENINKQQHNIPCLHLSSEHEIAALSLLTKQLGFMSCDLLVLGLVAYNEQTLIIRQMNTDSYSYVKISSDATANQEIIARSCLYNLRERLCTILV